MHELLNLSDDDSVDVFAGARKAASVLVLRDRDDGSIEALMLLRAERAGDMRSGVAVFPGGVLDERDRLAHAHCLGWTDEAASRRLGLADGGLDYWVAAARETFEEVGLLFTHGGGVDAHARAHAEWRAAMQRGERGVAALCEALGLQLDLGGWHYWSHWLTPPGNPKRFDTRFFVARAPAGQAPEADGGEATALMWLTPAEALDPQRGLKLLPVTRRTLADLKRFACVDDVLQHARQQGEVPITMPRHARTAKGPRIVLPDELPWAEIGRLDPRGRGDVLAEMQPGQPVRLSPRVIRVTAPNPGMMTGPGTNTYLVGDPTINRWTVIDPGPDIEVHVQAIVAAAPGPVERILVTHTHIDHSPAARALAKATGAPVLGRRPDHAGGQDADFAPDVTLLGGEVFTLGPGTSLVAMHTPGHASNHLCYLLPCERLLFTGDHLMQGSTVVINPPDGDMAAYLQSLQQLLALDLAWLAPGHGFLVAQPHTVVRRLIAHRRRREDKVLAALQAIAGDNGGAATLAELVPRVYEDTPAALHGLARRSLLAHLLKLAGEKRAVCDDGERWRAVV